MFVGQKNTNIYYIYDKFILLEDDYMKILLKQEDYGRNSFVYFYHNDKILKNRIIDSNYSYSKSYCSTSELKEDLDKINKLINTNLFKNLYGAGENANEKRKTLSQFDMSRKTYTKFDIYDSIYTNELIYSRIYRGQEEILSVEFKDRDTDIKKALFNNKISPVIASALVVGRDYFESAELEPLDDSLLYPVVLNNSQKITQNSARLKDNKSPLYRYFKIPKKGKPGEFRDIYEPVDEFKVCMQNLNRVLQAYFDNREKKNHTNQYAYIKNRSIIDNAAVHRNNNTIVKIDITKFFESIRFEYVEKYLRYLCKEPNLLQEFGVYITNPETGGLYMGNPISGTLANIMMYKVAVALQNIFGKRNMDISIYSDDLTVSTNGNISREMVEKIVEYVFRYYGLDFKLNTKKTKKLSKQNRRICGVTINGDNKLTTRRSDYEKTRVMLYKLSKGEDINIPIETLKGRMNFYYHIDETGKFDRLFRKYENVLNSIGFTIKGEDDNE